MTIICNVTGSERKRLVEALGAILLWEAVYTKAPTFAYVVNNYAVDKNGTILCPDSASPEEVEEIVAKLTVEGFTPEISEVPGSDETISENEAENPAEEAPAEVPAETPYVAAPAESSSPVEESTEPEETVSDENNGDGDSSDGDATKLTVNLLRSQLPDDVIERLRAIVRNKEVLFKRALLTDDLPIGVTEDKVSFPWFTLTGIDGEAEAYSQFISHLCKMASEQTRVLDKPYDGDNDRFAMRIFMVRMGMKGAQFALARKLMMKHLTGNSGWRYGAPPKKEDTPAEPDSMEESSNKEVPTDIPAETPDVAPEPESDAIPEEEDTEATEGEISPDAAASEAEGSEVDRKSVV